MASLTYLSDGEVVACRHHVEGVMASRPGAANEDDRFVAERLGLLMNWPRPTAEERLGAMEAVVVPAGP